MTCKVISFIVPDGPINHMGTSAAKAVFKCEVHNWMSDGVMVGHLCPIGRIEEAVEDGLAKLKAATE